MSQARGTPGYAASFMTCSLLPVLLHCVRRVVHWIGRRVARSMLPCRVLRTDEDKARAYLWEAGQLPRPGRGGRQHPELASLGHAGTRHVMPSVLVR